MHVQLKLYIGWTSYTTLYATSILENRKNKGNILFFGIWIKFTKSIYNKRTCVGVVKAAQAQIKITMKVVVVKAMVFWRPNSKPTLSKYSKATWKQVEVDFQNKEEVRKCYVQCTQRGIERTVSWIALLGWPLLNNIGSNWDDHSAGHSFYSISQMRYAKRNSEKGEYDHFLSPRSKRTSLLNA